MSSPVTQEETAVSEGQELVPWLTDTKHHGREEIRGPSESSWHPPTRSAPPVGGKVVRRPRAQGLKGKEEGTPEMTGQEPLLLSVQLSCC